VSRILLNVGNVFTTEKHHLEDDSSDSGVPNMNRLFTQFNNSASIAGRGVKNAIDGQKDVDAATPANSTRQESRCFPQRIQSASAVVNLHPRSCSNDQHMRLVCRWGETTVRSTSTVPRGAAQ